MDDYPADLYIFCNSDGDTSIKDKVQKYFGNAKNVFVVQSPLPNAKQYADCLLIVYLFTLSSSYKHCHILHGGDKGFNALLATAYDVHNIQNISQRTVLDAKQMRTALNDIFGCIPSAVNWVTHYSSFCEAKHTRDTKPRKRNIDAANVSISVNVSVTNDNESTRSVHLTAHKKEICCRSTRKCKLESADRHCTNELTSIGVLPHAASASNKTSGSKRKKRKVLADTSLSPSSTLNECVEYILPHNLKS